MIYQIGWLSLTSVLSFFNRTCSTMYYVLCTMFTVHKSDDKLTFKKVALKVAPDM